MAQLMKDRNTQYSLGDLLGIPLAAGVQIFAGSLVCTNEDGYAIPAEDCRGLRFEGVATEGVDNREGAAGDLEVVLRRRGRYLFDCPAALDQAAQGAEVYALEDHSVTPDVLEADQVDVGVIDKVEGPHDCWISIDAAVLRGCRYTPSQRTPINEDTEPEH